MNKLKTAKLGFGIVLATLNLAPLNVLAFTKSDQEAILNNTVFYDPNDFGCEVALADISLIGTDNIEKAFRYFIQLGLSPEQSAGILGNLHRESGVNPTAQQDRSKDPFPKANVGFGIAQWTSSGRQQNLVNYANSKNQPVTSLSLQLDFIWKEFNESYKKALDEIKATSSIDEATRIVMADYERPAEQGRELPIRVGKAKQIFALYSDGAAIADPAANGTASESGCITLAGETKFVDGFAVYSQYDPAWKDRPYSSSTIGVSGCGPSAMAMIITALTGVQVTPVETSNYAASQGMYVPGVGSSWSVGPVVARQWGLKAKALKRDVAEIAKALQDGALVIAPGQGPKPFTSGGHIIVVRGVTANGNFKVGDSGHRDTSDKEWDPEQLVSNMRSGGIYAITK